MLRERLGESLDGVVLDNGSGLSRQTRVSAALLGRVLQRAWSSAVMPELMASLPVTGLDGTLRRSRGNAATTGRAHLKTGSLRDVQIERQGVRSAAAVGTTVTSCPDSVSRRNREAAL